MNAESPRKAAPAGRNDAHELEKKATEIIKVALPVGTLGLALLAGWLLGPASAILVLAGGALVAVIIVFWASVRTLAGETSLSGADAYALGAPRAEEEKKRAVLRALKDLEFERSVGKISDEDYQALVAKYRAEAKQLLRVLDQEALPRREHVEALVNRRLRREGLLKAAPAEATGAADERDEGDEARADEAEAPAKAAPGKAKKRRKARAEAAANGESAESASASLAKQEAPEADAPSGEEEPASRVCAECGTVNDADAVFCKKCGARRAPIEPSAAPAKTAAVSEEEEAS